MLCSRCGKEIKQGNRFCAECGSQIEVAPAPPEPIQAPQLQPQQMAQPSTKNTTISSIIYRILYLIVCVTFVLFILTGSYGKIEDGTATAFNYILAIIFCVFAFLGVAGTIAKMFSRNRQKTNTAKSLSAVDSLSATEATTIISGDMADNEATTTNRTVIEFEYGEDIWKHLGIWAQENKYKLIEEDETRKLYTRKNTLPGYYIGCVCVGYQDSRCRLEAWASAHPLDGRGWIEMPADTHRRESKMLSLLLKRLGQPGTSRDDDIMSPEYPS